MAQFVREHYPRIQQLHVEPVWECGRCLTTHTTTPPTKVFRDAYLAAIEEQGNDGVRLVYSGARQDVLSDAFCAVSNGGFTVTPTGDVTSCFEVSYKDDPRAARYFYGAYDPDSDRFIFDEHAQEELSHLNVHNMPYCTDCFCKWHCAGDCAAKLLEEREPATHHGSARCDINRALTLRQIQRRLDWSEDG